MTRLLINLKYCFVSDLIRQVQIEVPINVSTTDDNFTYDSLDIHMVCLTR